MAFFVAKNKNVVATDNATIDHPEIKEP